MELISHEVLPNASPYQSAPTSPNGGRSPAMRFYSAPSSPAKEVKNDTLESEFGKANTTDDFNFTLDDFEFSTSRKFGDFFELEISQYFECFVEDQPQQQQGKSKRERGGSLPTMAFADELFYNGLVMPLKPPPRLEFCNENRSFSQSSIPSSPRSPQGSGFKVPFVHRATWKDDFDPFTVALQKVSDENRGRASIAGNHHRRTRSHSPFRLNNSGRRNQHEEKVNKHLDQQSLGQKHGLPKAPKGSPYSRFVIDQNKQVEQTSKGRKKPQKTQSGNRIRPVKTDQENEGNNVVVETGMKRIRSMLLKYASFGRENTINQSSTLWKKLSFKIKGNASGNDKKRGLEKEPKMEVMEFKRKKPTLALCSYGFEEQEKHGI